MTRAALNPVTLLVNSGSELTPIVFTPAREIDTGKRLTNLAKARAAKGTGRRGAERTA
jgi:hypothetical protein